MRLDGVDPGFLDLISKDKRHTKYFKMVKVGIPEEAGSFYYFQIRKNNDHINFNETF